MKSFIVLIGLVFSVNVWADKFLPLQTLRDQANTAHCWAYAMSHLLESRSLVRGSRYVLINVEKDVKYWVDYERMMHIYKTKGDTFLIDYEGGWQMEYWEALLKHGRHIKDTKVSLPDIWYNFSDPYTEHLPFMSEERPKKDPTLISFEEAKKQLRAFTNDDEAKAFITDYLNRWYGKPVMTTQWFDEQLDISETASHILGTDYVNDVGAFVLYKPVDDGKHGWAKYLDDRYWGYRGPKSKILELIRKSIDRDWPVTFDDVYHAMTIIAYQKDPNSYDTFYAVADSVPGKITWYSSSEMLYELNLVTFAKAAVADLLPSQEEFSMLSLSPLVDIDKLDHTDVPPR